MRPWAGRPNKALSLREIQSEQKAQKAQEDEDKNDVALQAALKASVADTYPSPKTPSDSDILSFANSLTESIRALLI